MRRSFVAELLKLRRRSVLAAAVSVAFAYAVVTTLVTFLSARSGADFVTPAGLTTTLESLAQPEGATTAFRVGIGFLGVILLAVFVSNVGFEFARGTFAAGLMRQPRRLRLLAGKMSALLLFLAAGLAVAELAGLIVGLAIAPARGVSTSAWFSTNALVEGLSAYGTAVFVASAWASFGMAAAILTRSVPIALGIALAWAGPIEHITERSWSGATGWFPGLLLETVSAGGSASVSSQRAFTMVLAYSTVIVCAAMVSFGRRDLTA